MKRPSSSAVEFYTAVCPTCGTRVDERLTDDALEVSCPDCFRPVRIPGRSEVEASKGTPAAPEEPGVYRLQAKPDPRAAQPGRSARPSQPKNVLVICGVCGARLNPPLHKQSYRVRCPDCHRPVRIPSPEEAEEQAARLHPPARPPEPVEPLPVPLPPSRPRPIKTFYSTTATQIRKVRSDPPPQWTYFEGVWLFPWQKDVVRKWLFLSLGLTMLGGLVAVLTMLMGGASSPVSSVMAFIALPAIWIFLWTASYGASACLTIIIETAAGNQRIEEWPDEGWRHGLFNFLMLIYLWGVAVVIGHFVGLASEAAGGPYWACVDGAVGLLVPYLVLSVLETGAWYMPFSGPVTRSILRCPGDWLIGYLLLGASMAGMSFVWGTAMTYSPVLTLLLSGFAWSAVWLISARLLGRLGWKITQLPHDEPETT